MANTSKLDIEIVCLNGQTINATSAWFRIKMKNKNEQRKEVDASIQRNAFFGHPENIIITMLCDSQKHIRELAFQRIMSARNTDCIVRKFTIPKIRFGAEHYFDLIDCNDVEITKPPEQSQKPIARSSSVIGVSTAPMDETLIIPAESMVSQMLQAKAEIIYIFKLQIYLNE
ncbi:hypothetical protein Bhyg_08569 [Pseudolycoriella hygida]|uniref:Uncharacterized protein n=1 Tax=Pseudolycoriella hygida TaxID=35572 RepID=A0A9Q0N501_9DIPT|nr:hypothetical protein Bhyg_08569 [Pseudolycoriella hygida]